MCPYSPEYSQCGQMPPSVSLNGWPGIPPRYPPPKGGPRPPSGACGGFRVLLYLFVACAGVPHRLVKKGSSRTFGQTPPHDLRQAYAERAAGAAPSGRVLRRAPRSGRRTRVGSDAPSRHYFIADTPPQNGPKQGKRANRRRICPAITYHPPPHPQKPQPCLLPPFPPLGRASTARSRC